MERFKRGGLDQELVEKAATLGQIEVAPSSFRFLQTHGFQDSNLVTQAQLVDIGDLDAQQAEAVKAKELAQFEEAQVLLLKGQARFSKFLAAKAKFETLNDSARLAFRIRIGEQNQEALQKHTMRRYPARGMDNPSAHPDICGELLR